VAGLRRIVGVVPALDGHAGDLREHRLAVHQAKVLLLIAVRRAVENPRACRQVAAGRAREISAEAEAARCAGANSLFAVFLNVSAEASLQTKEPLKPLFEAYLPKANE
jgi:hypothetical protein